MARSTYTLARPVPGTARRIYREQGIDGGSEMCDEVSPPQAGRYNFPWGLPRQGCGASGPTPCLNYHFAAYGAMFLRQYAPAIAGDGELIETMPEGMLGIPSPGEFRENSLSRFPPNAAMASSGTRERWRSKSPLTRCRLPGAQFPAHAARSPVKCASAAAANAPTSSCLNMDPLDLALPSSRIGEAAEAVADDSTDALDAYGGQDLCKLVRYRS